MSKSSVPNHGPDQVAQSKHFYTSDPRGSVHLHMDPTGFGSLQPISVPTLLRHAATAYPNNIALAVKQDGAWQQTTYKEYEMAVRTCAKALIKLGLERYHSVCIMGYNAPEWCVANLAAMYAGGFACGIYASNSPDACLHCIERSHGDIVIVQDRKQLDKIMEIKDKLKSLKVIVQYEGEPEIEGVLSWRELMETGSNEPDLTLDNVLKTISVNECCLLIFTSGTVGKPKAVMLSHDNLTYGARSLSGFLKLTQGDEVIVSYLPFSHIAAQMADIYMALSVAAAVYFADKDALQGSLVNTLQEVRPTFFFSVPRVFEKMNEKMALIGQQASTLKKAVAWWAKRVGLEANMDRMNGKAVVSRQYCLANKLVYSAVRKALGMERARNFLCGGAPLSADIKNYFWSLDLLLLEGWGMSETSASQTANLKDNFRLVGIGTSMTGCYTRVNNPDGNKQGELMVRGRNIFMGYLNDPDNTRSAFDNDGWFHTGDLGTSDDDGYLTITGRIKELIITSGGENIPPTITEDRIKAELPCISHAVLVGDQRKHLSVLLTFKTITCAATELPLDELSQGAVKWCRDVGVDARTVAEVRADKEGKVRRAIQEGIDRVNEKATSTAQRVQKFVVLDKDFAVKTGELGPTMKVKRSVVTRKNAGAIEAMYTDN